MSEQNKSDDKSSPAVPTIAIVALLVSLFAAQDIILKPTRPPMIDAKRTSTEDVRSRLWQDPFEAVEQHLNQYPPKKEEDLSSLSLSGTISQSERGKSTFTGSATISQKKDQSASRNCNKPIMANSIKEFHCLIKKELKDEKSLYVLAVMVPGGPYAENHEWRMRNRYAVISGLYTGKYVPQDAEHIKFINFRDHCKKAAKFCDFPDYVPYEFFEPIAPSNTSITKNENEKKILVLWLNNDTFAHSLNILKTLDQLEKQIQPISKTDKPPIKLNIIGPSNSHTLRQLYKEKDSLTKPNEYFQDNFIFSPFATADYGQLTNFMDKWKSKLSEQSLQNRIIRTISTDNSLAKTLLCEMALRGIAPYQIKSIEVIETIKKECHGLEGLTLTKANQPHHIVLIGELDTFYSQMLTESIVKTIDKFNRLSLNVDITETHVHRFNYLRGLDGITSKSSPANQDNKNKESQTNKLDSKETKEQAERPTGTSQLDYLRRLTEQIEQLNKLKAKEGGIKAIGITGNDTYDKLLILQALRKKFRNVLFFTTDLDARLFHPSEIKSTRNLIVASSYGLQLHQKLQKNTPPFRDSYQTSLYLTTLLALEKLHPEKLFLEKSLEAIIKDSLDKPRLFEIGNYGAVDLSHTFEKNIHSEPENASASKFPNEEEVLGNILDLIYLMFSTITLTLLLYCLLPENLKPIIVRACIGVICLILFYQIAPSVDGHGSEPLSFTNGTSIWPATGIRFVAFMLVISFLYSIRSQLKNPDKKIEEKYLPLLEGIRSTAASNETKNSLPWFLLDQWQIKPVNNIESINAWPHCLELRRLSYCGSAGCSCTRIILMFVLFIIFVTSLILVGFNIPEAPFRGITSDNTSFIILLLAVAGYLILTFVIADITRLTSHFITELTSCNIHWPPETISAYKKYGIPIHAVKNKILMDFIHHQANAINNFIYYPFFILFLLILSRNYFFDNWQISPLLLFIFIFTALITLGSAIRLRKASQAARDFILTTLENSYTSSLANDTWYRKEKNSDKIKLLINEIRNLKGGVFQPLSHHPIVLSWLIPFGSIAGISLFEYFAFSAS